MRDTFGIRGLKQTPPLQPWTLTTTTARSGVAAAGAGVTAPGTRAAHRIHGIGRSPPGQSPPTRLLQSKVDVGKNTIGAAYVEADNDMETAVAKTQRITKDSTTLNPGAKVRSKLSLRRTVSHPPEAAKLSTTARKTMKNGEPLSRVGEFSDDCFVYGCKSRSAYALLPFAVVRKHNL